MPSPPTRPVAGTVRTLALALALVPCAQAAGATLSEAESVRADSLARTVPWTAAPDGARATTRTVPGTYRGDGPTTTHPLGVQTLVVEREPRKASPATASGERLARVYQHDHGSRRTRRVRMDLASGAVLDARPIESPHLPLNDAERAWALSRLAADPALLERLRAEQRARGRVPFERLDALEVKASVFEPPDRRHPCHVERCALLSLFDATRTVFAIEPLVRFPSGRVETLDARPGGR